MKTKNNNKKYILYFNTSKDKELDVFLFNANYDGKERKNNQLSNANKAQQRQHSRFASTFLIDKIAQAGDYKVTEYLLKSIEQILNRNKVKAADLCAVMTVTGPGSFTSLRIACVVANTLGYSLKIPVIGIANKQGLTDNTKFVKFGLSKLSTAKVGKYISPFYNREPNITQSKKN